MNYRTLACLFGMALLAACSSSDDSKNANGAGGARCAIRVLRWVFGPLGPIDASTDLYRHFSVVQVKKMKKNSQKGLIGYRKSA